jgi:hypothetical protein
MTATQSQLRPLLDLAHEMVVLDEMILEADGDLSNPVVAAKLEEWWRDSLTDFNSKVDNYCGLIREIELRVARRAEESERLAMRNKAEQNAVKSLKDRMKMAMEFAGVRKAGDIRTATICGNGGKPPLKIDQPFARSEDIPEQFRKVVVSLNEEAVREAIESGEPVKFAHLEERGTHVRIK